MRIPFLGSGKTDISRSCSDAMCKSSTFGSLFRIIEFFLGFAGLSIGSRGRSDLQN
jgi:hypothetical protein